jgi:hypothetical protein
VLLLKKVCKAFEILSLIMTLTDGIAKFLYVLGLRRQPPLPELLQLAADWDPALRSTALKYFLDNYTKYPEYRPADYSHVAFVPVMIPDGDKELADPTSVRTC